MALTSGVQRLSSPDCTFLDAERVWRAYSRRAAVALFMTGSPHGCCDDLQRSAQAALHYLTSFGISDVVLSRMTPVLAAVACGDLGLASRLSSLLRGVELKADDEYEEDYLHILFLMATVVADRPEQFRRLTQIEQLDADAGGARFRMARALAAGDAVALDEALTSWLEGYAAHYAYLHKKGAIDEEDWVSAAHLSIEGIATVRLAAHLGFPLDSHYRFVPSLVLQASTPASAPDAWREP